MYSSRRLLTLNQHALNNCCACKPGQPTSITTYIFVKHVPRQFLVTMYTCTYVISYLLQNNHPYGRHDCNKCTLVDTCVNELALQETLTVSRFWRMDDFSVKRMHAPSSHSIHSHISHYLDRQIAMVFVRYEHNIW